MKTLISTIKSLVILPLCLFTGSSQAAGNGNYLPSSLPRTYPQEETAGPHKTLSPYFVVLSDDPETDRLPLKETRADVNIAGVIADVRVTQVYQNTGKNVLEAIYVFPASTRAAVYDMRMIIGEREIIAVVQEKQQARQLYEQAREEGKTASLLEQMRPNVFQMNVANILPGDIIRVEMKYTELLIPENGIYSFVYPTVVGPRYSSAGEENAPENDRWIANPYTTEGILPSYGFDIRVNLSAGLPVKKVQSTSHPVSIDFLSKSKAVIELEKGTEATGNRDFILEYGLSGGKIESGLLLYEGQEENFFLAMIQPPDRVTATDIPPREYVFILDVSGSMHGFPLDISKELMKELLEGLRPEDRFNILFFAGGSSLFSESSLPASTENIRSAINMVNNQQGGGGTELLDALRRALSLKGTEGYSRSFVIATDGYVSVEKESFDLIRNNLGNANFFPFGIGSSVNRQLIEGLAHVGMGSPVVLTTAAEAKTGAARFRRYIEKPVLTNIRVSFPGFDVYDVEPMNVPDVLAERPVIIAGKWKGNPAGTIRLTGKSGREEYHASLSVSRENLSENHSALAYLWAREKIRLLDDYTLVGADTREEVTGLGLKYNLLTAYTSFVAIDTEIRNISGNLVTVKQPLPLPQGVSNYAIGGVAAGAPRMLKSSRAEGTISLEMQEHDINYDEPETMEDINIVFLMVEKMPEFKGGTESFKKWLQDNLKYPEALKDKPAYGKVMLEFVVEADGRVSEIRVVRSIHPLLDREAVRVIQLSSGKWKAGVQKGKTVRVRMILPVEFREG